MWALEEAEHCLAILFLWFTTPAVLFPSIQDLKRTGADPYSQIRKALLIFPK